MAIPGVEAGGFVKLCGMDTGERDALLVLLLTPGMGQTLAARAIELLGSAGAVVGASEQALSQVRGISGPTASRMRRDMDALQRNGTLEREKELIERHGVRLLTVDEPAYPRLLKLIPDPPSMLFVRGELREDDALALAIVGSRRCSHYGREQADRFAAQAVTAGLCVVSGGAFGVDVAAHQAVLRMGGRTIAVIGSGLAKPYPERHADLFDMIADGHGAVMSELPMTAPPVPENFPRRNRIISGLALGVLVIEAAVRSGALITARLCVEEHGRECMALPGRVDNAGSAGCHKIIREGSATLVTSMADVLDTLGDTGQLLRAEADRAGWQAPEPPTLFEHNLTDTQRRIVDTLSQPRDLETLVAETGMDVGALQAELTLLQIRGLVSRGNGKFARKR